MFVFLFSIFFFIVESHSKRSVNVYTAWPSQSSIEWVRDARSSLTGVYPCCHGFQVLADGTFDAHPYDVSPLKEMGLQVIPVMGIDQKAVESGSGLKSAEDIAKVALDNDYDGFLCDYEPSSNATIQHAEAFAAFVKAASAALHAKNLKFVIDIAEWGILTHSDMYAKTGVDVMTSMDPTYYGTDIPRNKDYVKTTLKSATSNGQVEFGLGTMLVDETKAKWDYKWKEVDFGPFVKWCADEGVQAFALWRADIDNPQPANQTVEFYWKALHEFLHYD